MNSDCRSFALCASNLFVLVLGALVTLALFPQLAIAQQTLGSLNGTVTDASGAVVQKATVKARVLAPTSK